MLVEQREWVGMDFERARREAVTVDLLDPQASETGQERADREAEAAAYQAALRLDELMQRHCGRRSAAAQRWLLPRNSGP